MNEYGDTSLYYTQPLADSTATVMSTNTECALLKNQTAIPINDHFRQCIVTTRGGNLSSIVLKCNEYVALS